MATFFILQENGDRLFTENLLGFLITEVSVEIPPAQIDYQGDGKRRKRKKRRYETQVLFESIEETIRRTVLGLPEPTRPVPAEVAAQIPIDVSHGFEAALDQLTLLAEGAQDLSGRVAALRSAVQVYEAERQKRLEQDEEDFMMVL